MSMCAKEKWMSRLVMEFFHIPEQEAHDVFRNPKFNPLIQSFFEVEGPHRLFFFYQIPGKKGTDADDYQQMEGASPEFHVTDGDQGPQEKKLIGKGIYFVKVNPEKKVSKTTESDNEVLFGEISQNSISSLALIIKDLFKPYVAQLEDNAWGVCEEETKKDFLSGFEKFSKELGEAITSISADTKLEQPRAEYMQSANSYNSQQSRDPQMIAHFHQIFDSWNKTIQDRLDDSDVISGRDRKDDGPRSELEYWRK